MPLTDAECADVALTLASLFEVPVIVEACRPEVQLEALFAAEYAYISAAVPKRQAEFSSARVCARRALGRLGIAPCALEPYPDRAPRWPEGIVGSIAHTERLCAVVVTHAAALPGLGIDVEDDIALDRDLEHLICTPSELRWLDRYERERGQWSKLMFSAKEALYKFQYPQSHEFLDFRDVELEIDVEAQALRARLLKSTARPHEAIRAARGRWARQHGLVLTAFSY